jgi:DMSO reductase anchor subunit
MGGSYNTREFFHGKSAQFVRHIKWTFLTLTFFAPMLLLPSGNPSLLLLAFIFQYAGLLAERWFFFADANHPQNLYYQAVS